MGDVLSFTALLTEDAKKEVSDKLKSKDFYVGLDNKVFFSANTDIVEIVVSSMTG